MTVQIIDCEQNSPEWFDARKGIPTASEMSTIMSSSSGRGMMPVRTRYLYKLASEIITGKAAPEGFKSAKMERGNAMEAEARSAYSLITNNDVRLVGFAKNSGLIAGRTIGASPDGLVREDGAVETKTQDPDLLIHQLLSGAGVPSEHLDQLQAIMWVCELKWIDIWIFWPSLPSFRRTVKRDERLIAQLKVGVEAFFGDLDDVVNKIRRYGKD